MKKYTKTIISNKEILEIIKFKDDLKYRSGILWSYGQSFVDHKALLQEQVTRAELVDNLRCLESSYRQGLKLIEKFKNQGIGKSVNQDHRPFDSPKITVYFGKGKLDRRRKHKKPTLSVINC